MNIYHYFSFITLAVAIILNYVKISYTQAVVIVILLLHDIKKTTVCSMILEELRAFHLCVSPSN
jgi:hypothetical protein